MARIELAALDSNTDRDRAVWAGPTALTKEFQKFDAFRDPNRVNQ